MYETLHITDFLSKDQVDEIINGHSTYHKLFAEEYLQLEKDQVRLEQFQTSGFWPPTMEENIRTTKFDHERMHIEYKIKDSTIWGQEDAKPEYVEFNKRISNKFDLEEFHYFLKDLMDRGLNEIERDHGEILYTALYDFYAGFEVHNDGKDIKNKRNPRPESWDDLTYDDWNHDDGFEYTVQGLVSLDVEDPDEGTIMFNQSFPYSTYIDFSLQEHEFPVLGKTKPMLKFAKGDSIERFGHEIQNFTHELMNSDDYDEIMEYCVDETQFPYEATYGLSLERLCTFDTPGTMYTWDTTRYHKVRPYINEAKDDRRRLALAYHCGRFA